MSKQETVTPQQMPSDLYEIRVKSQLNDRWLARLNCENASRENDGTTRLTIEVTDQAALYGLFRTLRDLGLPLLSINRVDS